MGGIRNSKETDGKYSISVPGTKPWMTTPPFLLSAFERIQQSWGTGTSVKFHSPSWISPQVFLQSLSLFELGTFMIRFSHLTYLKSTLRLAHHFLKFIISVAFVKWNQGPVRNKTVSWSKVKILTSQFTLKCLSIKQGLRTGFGYSKKISL